MTTPATPGLPGMGFGDPTDPEGFVRAFIARYFTPGLIDSYIRTFVPAGLGYGLSWLALHYQWAWLPDHPSTTFTGTVTVATIAGYYFVARLVERKWPKVGRWLVALHLTSSRPVYVAPAAATAVEQAAATEPEDVARARLRRQMGG
jgi:hypothetical protein